MVFFRTVMLLGLLAAGISFALFVFTGQTQHKVRGLKILKWTLVGAFVFFAVMIADRMR